MRNFKVPFCAIVFAMTLLGCAHAPKLSSGPRPMLLIQGVHLDAKSWDAFRAQIDAAEFTVTDLGREGRDSKTPASLDSIARHGCASAAPGTIVVGHSFGGAVANAMFGICPEKISKIIYVSAVVPNSGEKPFDLLLPKDPSNYSKAVQFKEPKIIPRSPKTFFPLTDSALDPKGTLPRVYPEWMSLIGTPVNFDPARYVALPKYYVFTGKDTAISMTAQRRYVERTKMMDIATVETGHFPMLSDPDGLAAIVLKWAKH